MSKPKEVSAAVLTPPPPNPTGLIEMAISSGADIEKIEKLMDLQERWERNNAKKSFFSAMSAFQAEKPILIKDNRVNYTSKSGIVTDYNFKPLASIQKDIDPVLSKFGLSYSWNQDFNEGKIKITCVVKHAEGHQESNYLESAADSSGGKNSIQSIASAVSYLKRYTLECGLGLSSMEDNDGLGMSTEEQNAMVLEKIKALLKEKRDNLDTSLVDRVDQVIRTKEVSSYTKALKSLS